MLPPFFVTLTQNKIFAGLISLKRFADYRNNNNTNNEVDVKVLVAEQIGSDVTNPVRLKKDGLADCIDARFLSQWCVDENNQAKWWE